MASTYAVTGMHCQGCVRKINDAVAKVAGVEDVTVERDPDRLTVAGEATRDDIARAVSSAGDYQLGERVDGQSEEHHHAKHEDREPGDSLKQESFRSGYISFAVLVGFLLLGTTALTIGVRGDWMVGMAIFMGLFFSSFSFFKLLKPREFASSFKRYDLLAEKIPGYASVYPFIELALGVGYLLLLGGTAGIVLHAVAFAVMFVGGLGVLRGVLRKDRIRCACLGTVIDLPLGTVTLIEDFGMAAMAAVMLVASLT